MGEHYDRAQERVTREQQKMPVAALILVVIGIPGIVEFGWVAVALLALIAGLVWWGCERSWTRQLREAQLAERWAEEAQAATRARREARWTAREGTR